MNTIRKQLSSESFLYCKMFITYCNRYVSHIYLGECFTWNGYEVHFVFRLSGALTGCVQES